MQLIAALWRALPNRVNWWVLGWRHPRFMVSVVGVITDAKGRVLLLRHRFWNGRAWGLPSGYAHRDEALEAALAREIREETGLTIAFPRLVAVRRVTPAALEVVYRAAVSGGTLHPQGHEILDARFVAPTQLSELAPPHVVTLVHQALDADFPG